MQQVLPGSNVKTGEYLFFQVRPATLYKPFSPIPPHSIFGTAPLNRSGITSLLQQGVRGCKTPALKKCCRIFFPQLPLYFLFDKKMGYPDRNIYY